MGVQKQVASKRDVSRGRVVKERGIGSKGEAFSYSVTVVLELD